MVLFRDPLDAFVFVIVFLIDPKMVVTIFEDTYFSYLPFSCVLPNMFNTAPYFMCLLTEFTDTV